jgi:hypothetical protein
MVDDWLRWRKKTDVKGRGVTVMLPTLFGCSYMLQRGAGSKKVESQELKKVSGVPACPYGWLSFSSSFVVWSQ